MIVRKASICAAEAVACSFSTRPVDAFAARGRRQGPRVTIDVVAAGRTLAEVDAAAAQVDRRTGRFRQPLQYGVSAGFSAPSSKSRPTTASFPPAVLWTKCASRG
jgi:hypothetical protein